MLGFRKTSENSTDRSHMSHIPFPVSLSYISYGTHFTINELLLIHYYSLKFLFYSDFLCVYLMAFSVLGTHLGSHITFSRHVTLGFSRLWLFLRLSLFWMTLTVWKNTGQVFYRMSLNWDLADVFLVVRLRVWDLGRRPQRRSALFSTYQDISFQFASRAHTVNMTYPCWC